MCGGLLPLSENMSEIEPSTQEEQNPQGRRGGDAILEQLREEEGRRRRERGTRDGNECPILKQQYILHVYF